MDHFAVAMDIQPILRQTEFVTKHVGGQARPLLHRMQLDSFPRFSFQAPQSIISISFLDQIVSLFMRKLLNTRKQIAAIIGNNFASIKSITF